MERKKWFGLLKRTPFCSDIFRYIFHILFSLAAIAFEIGFLPYIRLFGAHGMLLYGLSCGIGYFESARTGAIFGGGIGLFAGLLYGQKVLFLPLTLAVCGTVSGIFSSVVFRHRYLTWLYSLLLSLVLEGIVSTLFITIRWRALEPLLLLRMVGGELILSLCFSHLLYLPQKAISRLHDIQIY